MITRKKKLMKSAHVYPLFFMFIFCTPGKGQTKTELPPDTVKAENKVTATDGPTTAVRTIKQDRKGNIWLASNEGIIRYDGKSFTNITVKLTSDRFFSVLEDRKGNF
ncbi:MAG TPA: two-component regulator propeller domain-containing protein, partial [Segetibacter sp.]